MPLHVSNLQDSIAVSAELEKLLARLGAKALAAVALPPQTEVGVALMDDSRIGELNRAYRGIDAPTDVLAFPLSEPGEDGERWPPEREEEHYLGDVAVSLETAARQAAAQGHPLEREVAYLVAHGILHLAGYDHECEQGARLMRAKEEEILAGVDRAAARPRLPRTTKVGRRGEKARAYLALQGIDAAELLGAAWEARRYAHAPYSGFAVGAALLGRSGAIYRGCNLENASYGLTLCAERAALAQAVLGGERGVAAVAVVARGDGLHAPCGACRQALAEFGPNLTVITQKKEGGDFLVFSLAELLPVPFRL